MIEIQFNKSAIERFYMFDYDGTPLTDDWNKNMVSKLHEVFDPVDYKLAGKRKDIEFFLEERLGKEYYVDLMIPRFVNEGMAAYI